MPAHDVVFVRIGLLRAAIVNDDAPIFLLNLPYIGLHDLPQFGRPKPFFGQPPLNLVMVYAAFHQPCQTCPCRLTERTDKIITIDVQQFCVFRPVSLARAA